MDRYHPTVPTDVGDRSYKPTRSYSFGSLEGYLNARVFLEILRRAGKNPTRSSFYEAAERMGRFDLGLGVPLEFSTKRHQALDEVWLTHATATGWSPSWWPFSDQLLPFREAASLLPGRSLAALANGSPRVYRPAHTAADKAPRVEADPEPRDSDD